MYNFNCITQEIVRPDKPVPFPDLNLPTPDPDSNDDLPDEDGPYDERERKPPDSYRDWWYHSDHLGSSTYLTDNFGRPSHYYETLPFGEMIVEHNQSTTYSGGQYENAYKFNGKELDEATQMYYYGARYYDPRISIFVSVDPMAERTMTPYQYVNNNPIRYVDPTGMSGEDWIDIDQKSGEIKITPNDENDIVRLMENGNVVDSYEYGEKGSFKRDNEVERNGLYDMNGEYDSRGYKVHFQDASKADRFYKFAAQSDKEFALVNIFYANSVNNGQSTVLTNYSSRSVRGSKYAYDILRKNPDAYLLNFSHSHPGKVDPKTLTPAYPSGFDENLNPVPRDGDRHRYLDGRKEFGNRIPDYHDIYIPQSPNIKVKFNGEKVIRTIN